MLRKLVDFVFLTRPTLILPGWGFYVLGYLHVVGRMGDLRPVLNVPSLPEFWYGFLSATFISAYIYVLNQIYDRESDRLNRKLFLIADGHIGVGEAGAFALLLLLLSFVFGALVGTDFLLLLIAGAVVGTLYSLPPFRFKGRPFLDMLSNALGYAVLNVSAGYVAGGGNLTDSLSITVPYFFAVSALYLNTTVPDIPGDRRAGLITTGVLLGERVTATLGAFFVLLTVLFSLWPSFNPMMAVVGAVSLPFYIWGAVRGDEFSIKLAYRVSGVAFVLALIVKYPPFLLPALTVFVALKLYYHLRFNLDYPSLTGR